MRIAVIADIHANVPALEAVLEALGKEEFDEVLVGGDLVGRGPQGSAICRRIRELGWRSVRGNHEDYLIDFRHKRVDPAWLTLEEWSAARWMAAELETEDVTYIESLPFEIRAERDDGFALFHGSPKSNFEGLGSWTAEEVLLGHLDSVACDVMAVAHTHRPISWTFDNRLLANVGSVGLPFTGDPRAQYAVFTRGERWEVEARYVDYDRDEALRLFETTGFLEAGGTTSLFLTHEIRTARPHLVPFLRWIDFHDHPNTLESAERFLDIFDPTVSLAMLIETLKATP